MTELKEEQKPKETKSKLEAEKKEVEETPKPEKSKNIKKDKNTDKKDSLGQTSFYLGSVSKLNISLSIRQIGLMLKSGLSLSEAVSTLTEQTPDARLTKAYGMILQDIESGMNLADSMKKHPKIFTEIIISIVSVGEQAGTLEKNLLFLADYIKKQFELDRKLQGALIYPIIILGLTMVEMTGVVFLILPKLQELFRTFDNIPPFTMFILNATQFVRENIYALLGGAFILFILISQFLKTKIGKKFTDKLALNFPVINNLTRNSVLTGFARTLAILLETGIPIARALEITAETTSNDEYQIVLRSIHEKVKNGQNLAEALEEYPKYFPPTFTKMISVGEKTGTLEVNLFYLYEYHEGEVKEMSENLTTLLEPILLIFIGLMIFLLAITIIGPIYQLTGSING